MALPTMAPDESAAAGLQPGQRDEVLGTRHAARGHHRQRRGLQQGLQPGQVGARQHAVAGHRRGHDGADGLVLPQLEQLGHGLARSGQPPLRLRLGHPVRADPVVEPDGDPARPAAGTAAGQRRLLERRRAEDDPGHTGVRAPRRRRPRSGCRRRTPRRHRPPLAELHDPAEDGSLVRHAGAGPVEVDDVDPARAAGDVAGRQRRRVAVAVLAPEVTLGQPHRGAGAQVDGRQQLHHAAARAASHEVGQQRQPGRRRTSRGGTARPRACRGWPAPPRRRRSRTRPPSRRPTGGANECTK